MTLLSISGLIFITIQVLQVQFECGSGLGDMIGPNGNYKNIPDLSKWL